MSCPAAGSGTAAANTTAMNIDRRKRRLMRVMADPQKYQPPCGSYLAS
jgi:hypothetical protein